MSRTIQIAPVRKSVVVNVSAQRAFEVFCGRIDRWWPKSHGIGAAPIVESVIEPFVGGRWYARCADGVDVVTGHVLHWEPGRRVVFSWEVSAQWKSDPRPAYASEVEVLFIADGDARTRVELEHSNFERMEEGGAKLRQDVDNGWPGLLALYAQAAGPGDAA